MIFAIKSKIHCETKMLGHFNVGPFFVIFGSKMNQKRVKTQFFGIVALCIIVPNDPTKDKKFS